MKNTRIIVSIKDLIFISATSFVCGVGLSIVMTRILSEGYVFSFIYGGLSLLLLIAFAVGVVMMVIFERREKGESGKEKGR